MGMMWLGLLVGLVLGAVSILHVYDKARPKPTPALDEAHGRYKAELDRLHDVHAEHGAGPLADFAALLDGRSDA